jgi:putative ABC transport system permease protein
MIGGLDRYDQGDLLVNHKSTKHFKDDEWDRYRNHTIGFIFQNYNLINHISVLDNVIVGLTLTGMDPVARKERALEVLDRVGLKEHRDKKPNQLSGGQMQRVAIARALANNPDIILADEPTGAIDTETSKQIMTLIQEIAKDKLVIMVTHDERIAKQYADRTISLSDGKVTDDSNPHQEADGKRDILNLKKTAMSFTQALKLSFNNLKTKKFRTIITAFAGSIGIIGVALVLSLANGLNNEIDNLEQTTLAEFPIQIDPIPINVEAIRDSQGYRGPDGEETPFIEFPDVNEIYPYEESLPPFLRTNTITNEYLEYVRDLDNDLYHEITVNRPVSMNVIKQFSDTLTARLTMENINFEPSLTRQDTFEENYELLSGSKPSNQNELLLVVDRYNRLDVEGLNALGLDGSVDSYTFDDFLGMEFKVILPDDFYIYNETTELFSPVSDLNALYDSNTGITIEITGIARVKENAVASFLSQGIKYHPDLLDTYVEAAQSSTIGQAQLARDESVITGLAIDAQTKQSFLRNLGVNDNPSQIRIYPVDFAAKNAITEYLDAYNEGLDEEEQIIYTDLASVVTELTGDIIDGVSYVLIAFSAISLIVSSIMIGIITYVSVLERTKEIGILRSLGARKRDISRVFNAETTIIGFVAGTLGVIIAFLLTFPINALIHRLVDGLGDIAQLPFIAVVVLIIISIFLTFIAGLIPSSIASRKNPVDALRVD